jgi:hypothetical protein
VDAVRAIADAVLYEGYVLWPYRRSAIKNQQRFTFGGVYPQRFPDTSTMQSQCLLEGDGGGRLDVRVRFLQVVRRQAGRVVGNTVEPVDELTVGEDRHLSWDEAVEREVAVPDLELGALGAAPRTVPIEFPAGEEQERLTEDAVLMRSWEELRGRLEVAADSPGAAVQRVTVRVTNETAWDGGDRAHALRRTFCSTHAILHSDEPAFVSLTDPPEPLRTLAEECENVGVWPVLVGEDGARDTMLASPIILPDYPQIAPESPGDLFDATEIDELLTLNILALTDAEKAEMRASDPRAREILDRAASLTPEQLMQLHGAVRDFRVLP